MRRATTRAGWVEQVTPAQEVQREELVFQLSFLERRWGTAAEKSSRACLSEFRSAVAAAIGNGKKVMMNNKQQKQQPRGREVE